MRGMRFLPALIVVLVAGTASPSLQAQVLETIEIGDRLRIASPKFSVQTNGELRHYKGNERPLIGSLQSQQTGHLKLMASHDSLISVPMSAVQTIEIEVGKKKDRGKGALYGLLIGVGAGVITGVTVVDEECEGCFFAPVLFFGGGGAGIGAAIGVTTTDWARVYPEQEPSSPTEELADGSRLGRSPQ